MVIYCVKCDTCDAEYFWKIERILSQIVYEDQEQDLSACKQHLTVNQKNAFDFYNIKIMDTAENDFQLNH